MTRLTAARTAATLAVAGIAWGAALFTQRYAPWALPVVLVLAVILLVGLLRFREWARRVVVVLGWIVSLFAALLVGLSLVVPSTWDEGYFSDSSAWLLGYAALWVPAALAGLLGWLYFRRASIRALFRPAA